jgi:endoglucanase
MIILSTILISALILSLFLSYQSNLPIQKSAIEIVNEMGFGYNLANSFDCYNNSIEINNPNEQITLLGNPIPTQKMINNIKKNGFKTIRFPVTWANFIDNLGNVNPQWMLRVKEVVKWIINKNIYCILNIYHDSDIGIGYMMN